jgi:hypothetical protein
MLFRFDSLSNVHRGFNGEMLSPVVNEKIITKSTVIIEDQNQAEKTALSPNRPQRYKTSEYLLFSEVE